MEKKNNLRVTKKMCGGCPFDYGMPETEMAYNLGCLPSLFEIRNHIGDDHSWP